MTETERLERRRRINEARPLTENALVMIELGSAYWEGKLPLADDVLQLVGEVRRLRALAGGQKG